jgi:hypothetical protein
MIQGYHRQLVLTQPFQVVGHDEKGIYILSVMEKMGVGLMPNQRVSYLSGESGFDFHQMIRHHGQNLVPREFGDE